LKAALLVAAKTNCAGGALTAVERLTTFDRAALAAFCNAYALWLEAVDGLQKYGTVMKSAERPSSSIGVSLDCK
jgi:phage terminase small subunit